MEEKKRLALIDLDTLIYIVASNQLKNGNRDNPEQVKTHIREFINIILVNTRADYFSAVYQDKGHDNYRKYFYPDYKANRPEAPDFIILWKDTIVEAFKDLGAIGVKVIESDDVLNIGYHRYKDEYNLIIVSGDKDLDQIPGEHYNPKKNVSYEVSEPEAVFKLYTQILMGDATDGIQGIPGVGIKTAEKLLLTNIIDVLDYAGYTSICHEQYQKSFLSTWYSEYLKTKFLVTLLDTINYKLFPFNNEVSKLFNIVPCTNLVTTSLFE